jgi:hypothetical protein
MNAEGDDCLMFDGEENCMMYVDQDVIDVHQYVLLGNYNDLYCSCDTKFLHEAYPGTYIHTEIFLYKDCWINLIYDSSCSRNKIMRHVCKCDLYSDKNVLTYWDLCEFSTNCEKRIKDDMIAFIPIRGNKEILMNNFCIEGDYHYAFKLTDSVTGAAFAFGYGDVLVNTAIELGPSAFSESLTTDRNKFLR